MAEAGEESDALVEKKEGKRLGEADAGERKGRRDLGEEKEGEEGERVRERSLKFFGVLKRRDI